MIIYSKNSTKLLGDYPPDYIKIAYTGSILNIIRRYNIAIAKCCIQGYIGPHHVTDSTFSDKAHLNRIG